MDNLAELSGELNNELYRILDYWDSEARDEENGGFIGQIDHLNFKNHQSSKGLILNARILWAFSAAVQLTAGEKYLTSADRSFNYITDHFYDNTLKGFYWCVNSDGSIKDSKKHIYAQAFCIYGLSEYYKISQNPMALTLAKETYHLIKEKGKNSSQRGYNESYARDWSHVDDVRLSDKDVNVPRTMNTHLHLVEAFANLYGVWPDEGLRLELIEILNVIKIYFIDENEAHLRLFFDKDWKDHSDVISYGHDVEAAWLLLQCAQKSKDNHLVSYFMDLSVRMIDATLGALDDDGGLWYELDLKYNKLILEKHWWPQAEFMIGAMNAFQLTGNERYLALCLKNWNFIKDNIRTRNADWTWGIDAKGLPLAGMDMVGFWKCPYHNSRMCLEIIQRIEQIKNN